MNLDLLVDPLFRVPFLTGLLLAGLLPLIGMYLRLRGEWLAADVEVARLGVEPVLEGLGERVRRREAQQGE